MNIRSWLLCIILHNGLYRLFAYYFDYDIIQSANKHGADAEIYNVFSNVYLPMNQFFASIM